MFESAKTKFKLVPKEFTANFQMEMFQPHQEANLIQLQTKLKKSLIYSRWRNKFKIIKILTNS